MQIGEFLFEGGHFGGQFAAQVDQLVDGDVGLLKFVEDFKFFLGALLGLCEVLLQGNESFALVHGSRHFRCFLGGCHIDS